MLGAVRTCGFSSCKDALTKDLFPSNVGNEGKPWAATARSSTACSARSSSGSGPGSTSWGGSTRTTGASTAGRCVRPDVPPGPKNVGWRRRPSPRLQPRRVPQQAADGRGTPLAAVLTPAEAHESKHAEALRVGRRRRPRRVAGDKGYSYRSVRRMLRDRRIAPLIPTRWDQPTDPAFDREAYERRNVVE